MRNCAGRPLMVSSQWKYGKSWKCHLFLSGVAVLWVKFSGSAANSKEEIKRVWKRQRATMRECAKKRKERETGAETKRKWVNQKRRKRRNGGERRDREMIDGAKMPISCFIWSALLCNQQTHTCTDTLQSTQTHTHPQHPSHRLLVCNQHTGYWSELSSTQNACM